MNESVSVSAGKASNRPIDGSRRAPGTYVIRGLIFFGFPCEGHRSSRPVASSTLTLMYPISGVGTGLRPSASGGTRFSK